MKKSVEETYKQWEEVKHILARPDTHVGNTQFVTEDLWVLQPSILYQPSTLSSHANNEKELKDEKEEKDEKKKDEKKKDEKKGEEKEELVIGDGEAFGDVGGRRMENRRVRYVPALYKIVDEAMVNAADQVQRGGVTMIKVTVDPLTNRITVWNNGPSIPIEMHKVAKMYVPEFIFGELRSSSNFDDDEKRTTGGRNGLGIKCTNIFSILFSIDIQWDGQRYQQTWKNNKSIKQPPKIRARTHKNYTCVSFVPDLERFGSMQSLDNDIVALIEKRCYDLAATCPKVKVYFNDRLVPVRSFKQYVDLFLPTPPVATDGGSTDGLDAEEVVVEEAVPRVFERVNDRWEVCIAQSDGNGFQQMSFVNSVCTTKGGRHVDCVVEQLIEPIQKELKRGQKEKDLDVSQKMIQNHLFVFVNALIVNPAFDSQVKAALTTPKNKFGSKCILSERTIKKIVKSTIVTSLRDLADHKANKALKKSDGSLRGDPKVPKHEDASATTKDRHKCTLILTEGDSAKALAMAGLSVVGRKYFGVFPLRGKPINPRDEQVSKIVKNVEFQAIKKILGLKNGEKYTDVSQLRYGKVWIMADADKDGLHIVGLFVNIIIFYWPELAKIPGFLQIFITPVVKASRGKTTLSFESESAYHRWKDANDGGAGWTVKWYKGLGTSTAIEAKEYFSDLPRHTIPFRWGGPLDQAALILAFGKQRQMADARKRWLAAFKVNDPSQPDPVLAMRTAGHVTYEDFVNKQLILYAVANCERHIPSLIDGFKHASRKILFAAFKRNLCREIKVASLAGYVIEQAAYLHGEDSCCGTIVFLAQDYVGSNNLNLLMPSGQFGTRAENGDDAASPRYINTFLSPLARLLFHPHDDMLLVHLKDEGEPIEPVNYLPIIPILLVNGCHGAIGSGWSSKIPRHNPHDIGRLIKTLLDDPTGTVVLTPATHPLKPWVRGFRGEIVVDEKRPGNYIIRGIAKITETEEDGTCTVEITEVPYDMSLSKYVEILQKMKAAETLVKLVNETVEDKIMYRVKLSPKHMKRATEKGGLLKYLHLESSINTNNLVAYDAQGQIKRYATTHEMLNEFFKFRLPYYTKRKQVMIDTLTNELNQLDNRIRFILMVVEEKQIKVRNVAKAVIIHQLAQLHFPPIHNKHHKSNATNANNEPNDGTQADLKDDGVAAAAAAAASGYDYLLGMPLWSLTLERVVALKKKVAEKKAEVKELQNTLPQQMWRQDIDNLLSAIDKYESIRTAQNQEASNRYTKKQTSKKQLSNKKKRSPSTKPKTPKPSKKQSV